MKMTKRDKMLHKRWDWISTNPGRPHWDKFCQATVSTQRAETDQAFTPLWNRSFDFMHKENENETRLYLQITEVLFHKTIYHSESKLLSGKLFGNTSVKYIADMPVNTFDQSHMQDTQREQSAEAWLHLKFRHKPEKSSCIFFITKPE